MPGGRATPTGAQWAVLVAVAGLAFAVDVATKHLVTEQVALGELRRIAGPLVITHVHNAGIAFGLLGDSTRLMVGAGCVIIIVVIGVFGSSNRGIAAAVGFGLIVGGACGNVIDRARYGYVTDFLATRPWPSANLADVFIILGVLMLLAGTFRRGTRLLT